jgi:aerobic carbon-monoxide dehydrogenase medium subunit
MITQQFSYATPTQLSEALELLAAGGKALAGGQSLIPMMKLRLAAPEQLVDLRKVEGLNFIGEEGGRIRIGAMTTHYQIESSPLLRGKCPLLTEAATLIGDVQVRNLGTIGGSIAHADPAADWPASLQALEAEIRIAGPGGERTVSAADFFIDAFTTAVEPGELVVEISVPVEDSGTGVSYQKMAQPASGFAIVGVAARVRKTGAQVTMARVGITGLGAAAFRATNVEQLLEGTQGSEAEIAQAAAVAGEGVDANSDIHASAGYRAEMAKVYTARALRVALSRAS